MFMQPKAFDYVTIHPPMFSRFKYPEFLCSAFIQYSSTLFLKVRYAVLCFKATTSTLELRDSRYISNWVNVWVLKEVSAA